MLIPAFLSLPVHAHEEQSIEQWHARWWARCQRGQDIFAAALETAWEGNCIAAAFVPAYQAALRQLVPSLAEESALVSLCISEEQGNHPRAIESRLTPAEGRWCLNGQKSWASLSAESSLFLIAARTNEPEDERAQLRLVRVVGESAGVQVKPMPSMPFVPEVSHCRIALENVSVDEAQLLPGDAYVQYIKPFRFIEDVYVTAAISAYLLRCLRLYAADAESQRNVLSVLSLLAAARTQEPSAVQGHLLFDHAQELLGAVVNDEAAHWHRWPDEARKRWKRDQVLLNVANKARVIRRERALAALEQSATQR